MAKIEKNMIEALLARPTSKQVLAFEGVFLEDLNAVSYTHLDVYKRQAWRDACPGCCLKSRELQKCGR